MVFSEPFWCRFRVLRQSRSDAPYQTAQPRTRSGVAPGVSGASSSAPGVPPGAPGATNSDRPTVPSRRMSLPNLVPPAPKLSRNETGHDGQKPARGHPGRSGCPPGKRLVRTETSPPVRPRCGQDGCTPPRAADLKWKPPWAYLAPRHEIPLRPHRTQDGLARALFRRRFGGDSRRAAQRATASARQMARLATERRMLRCQGDGQLRLRRLSWSRLGGV